MLFATVEETGINKQSVLGIQPKLFMSNNNFTSATTASKAKMKAAAINAKKNATLVMKLRSLVLRMATVIVD